MHDFFFEFGYVHANKIYFLNKEFFLVFFPNSKEKWVFLIPSQYLTL